MKKFIALISMINLILPSFATIHIVDNNPGSIAPFTTISSAITAASTGDTIYVMGSVNKYTECLHNWDKKLILIGPGHNPQKQNSLQAVLDGCGPNIDFKIGSAGSKLIGFTIFGSHNIWVNGNIDSLTYSNNLFHGRIEVEGSGYLIENNVFTIASENIAFIGTSTANTIIKNNIFCGTITNAKNVTTEIINNIFLKNGSVFSGITNVFIKNNIFHNGNPSGTSNATFLNNITFQTTDTLPTAGNYGSGNIISNPQFVNVGGTSYNFSYSHNYNLQTGSPGINAGTDGKDIGVYGGMGIFKMGGEPGIPIIREFTIKNAIVPPNGNLEIKIKAETQD